MILNRYMVKKSLTVLNAVEIILGGWGLEDAPCNKAQIREFMHSMIMVPGYEFSPWIADLFDILCDDSVDEPIVGLYPSRMLRYLIVSTSANLTFVVASSSYVQYHLASDLPSNFVATGDAIMETNPIFG